MESTTSLTGAMLPMASSAILLSQGVGVRYEFLDITLIPLLGSLLFVMAGAAVCTKMPRHALSYASFAFVWIGLDCLVFEKSPLTPTDSFPVAFGKFALVVIVSFVIAQGNAPIRAALKSIRARISQPLARTLDSSLRMSRAFLVIMAAISLTTVMVWIVLGFDAMRTVASFLSMGNATFWSSCVITLLWLPDLCLWAMSWVVGSGFSIGQIATFTLWNGQASDLPAIPVFGIFPTAVADARMRTMLEASPALAAFIVGCFFLWSRKRLDILHRRLASRPALSSPRSIVDYILALVGMCLSCIWIVIACLLAFMLSTGSLGTGRLRRLGIDDVWVSTRAVSKPAAMGFFVSLLLFFLVSCIQALVGVVRNHRHAAKSAVAVDAMADHPADFGADAMARPATGFSAQSAGFPTDGSLGRDADDDSRGSGANGHDAAHTVRQRPRTAAHDDAPAAESSEESHDRPPQWHADVADEPHSIREALDSRYFPSESSLPATPAAQGGMAVRRHEEAPARSRGESQADADPNA